MQIKSHSHRHQITNQPTNHPPHSPLDYHKLKRCWESTKQGIELVPRQELMNPLDSSAQTSSLSCQSASQSVSIRPTAPPVQLSSDYLKHIIRYRSIDVLHQCISPLGFVYPFRTETLHPPKHREWMTSWWLTFCHFLISGVYAGVSACMRAFLRRQSCWTENQTPRTDGLTDGLTAWEMACGH